MKFMDFLRAQPEGGFYRVFDDCWGAPELLSALRFSVRDALTTVSIADGPDGPNGAESVYGPVYDTPCGWMQVWTAQIVPTNIALADDGDAEFEAQP